MTQLKDFTKWNRPGLRRFRYIDGNAATYLETIRKNLAERFMDWDSIHPEIPSDEGAPERLARLKAQYNGPRRDWAWEIARTFARSMHSLTEHIDAYANEGFIGTATQWDYLRRLVDLIDYRPHPPASASVPLALIAKPDISPGTVKAGLQLSHTPSDGGDSVTFETLREIEVDPALNAMRLLGWDYNPTNFDPFVNPSENTPWTLPEKHQTSAGSIGIIVQNKIARAVEITHVEDRAIHAQDIDYPSRPLPKYIRGATRLLVEPDKVYVCGLNGPNVITVSDSNVFTAGQIIGFNSGSFQSFGQIAQADRWGVKISNIIPNQPDLSNRNVRVLEVATQSQSQFVANGNEWRLPLGLVGQDLLAVASNVQGQLVGGITQLDLNTSAANGSPTDTHLIATNFNGSTLNYISENAGLLAENIPTSPLQQLLHLKIEGGPGKIKSGDVMVAEDAAGRNAAVYVDKVKTYEDYFVLSLKAAPSGFSSISRIYGPFKHELRPDAYDRNPKSVTSSELYLDIPTDSMPPNLVIGKTLMLRSENSSQDDSAKPFLANVKDIVTTGSEDAPLPYPRIVLSSEDSALSNHTIGSLILHGNCVLAGHGEIRPTFTLGDGDATINSQSFVIEREDVSFTNDDILSCGVRAALDIQIEGQRYKEVSSLSNSEAAEAHYITRMTEDGFVQVIFGDGHHGRRLATGLNNIRVTLRQGSGAVGNNVAAYGFEKPLKPHPLVDKIVQPLPSSGGQNIEDTAKIRKNAPASLKALGRGVSLSDFEHLVSATPGIWHAKASQDIVNSGRQNLINIVVVPAGNTALGHSLKKSIEARLKALSPPGTIFQLLPFDPVPLDLQLSVQVDSRAFDTNIVDTELRNALFKHLNLESRTLGQSLYLSEIYKYVETVTGVTNSKATLFPQSVGDVTSQANRPLMHTSRDSQGTIWAVKPTDLQSIFLSSLGAISITFTEVSL